MHEITINGPAGRLEAQYYKAKEQSSKVVLLLHPEPHRGGTMHNKIVRSMMNAFIKYDFSVLRFNFRGVGRSEGAFDNGEGELYDAAAALDWLQAVNPNNQACWVGGFSFGALIAMQLLMRRPDISRFISISPPVHVNDFSFLAPCPSSGLIVHSGNNTIVPEPAVARLVEKLSNQRGISVDYKIIPGADQVYSEHIGALENSIIGYIDQQLKQRKKKAAGSIK